MAGLKSALLVLLAVCALGFAALEPDELAAAQQIIKTNVSCGQLNTSQLELLGDYFMEQMHPGAEHGWIDQMMGGEGSASLDQAHLQMAEVIYCGQTNASATYGGMIAMMPLMGRFSGYGGPLGMGFGGGMMSYSMMDYGMGYGGWWWVGALFWVLVFMALVLLIYWLYRSARGGSVKGGSASDILKERYAKGELTKKQFDEMRKDIG